ncbi:hypothetical protein NM688_g1119 [Phlebia brevispora]|uniref:Uncharacterized protein n=1 Tax=Phlebia brevispora TaxID=194682 RepID=A0ACC1TCM5_9APHY|nr:hypothetical protein NM688_g1119 [Phlebia brevispora]
MSSDTEYRKKSSNKKKSVKRENGGKGGVSRPSIDHLSLTSLAPTTDRKLVSQAAMRESLTGGTFVDTKFYAFSRKSSGVVDKPMAVYANSALLRHASKYFEGLLAGGYREDAITSLDDPFPKDRPDSTEEYEYYSDSDLDDEEEHGAELDLDFNLELNDSEKAEPKAQESATKPAIPTWSASKGPDEKPLIAVSSQPTKHIGGRGRVIVLPDIAFTTLKSLIFYIYTGEVVFAPLESQKKQKATNGTNTTQTYLYNAPPCSPKSMYRIADKYGLDDLKQKAANDIKTKLSSDNILDELFSTVTSTYDDIRTTQVAFACDKTVCQSVATNIAPWITRVATGELAHCEAVVSALFKQMAGTMTGSAGSTTQSRAVCSYCSNHIVATMSVYCSSCRGNRNIAFS